MEQNNIASNVSVDNWDTMPALNPNSVECIRCGECINICPNKSLSFKIKLG